MRRDDKVAEARKKLAKMREQMMQTRGALDVRSAQIDGLNRSTDDPAKAPNSNAGKNIPQIFSEADKKQEVMREYKKIDRLNQMLGNPIGEDNQSAKFTKRLEMAEFNYPNEVAKIERLMRILDSSTETAADDFIQSLTGN